LMSEGDSFDIHISPYSLGCGLTAELATAETMDQLEAADCAGKILLLKDDIASEQLMPKKFVFYNPDHHRELYALLEAKQPAAVIAATRRQPETAGALYPLPMIEDGDFDIPSFFCSETVGGRIAAKNGRAFTLKAGAERIPATAANVVARKNPGAAQTIVVCAHIDAYGDSPGAGDNASGVVVLLLLAEALRDYEGPAEIELIAFNGEDHYSAGGEMDYLNRYGNDLARVKLAINLDYVGCAGGRSAYSFYNCPAETQKAARRTFDAFAGLTEGPPWHQGDHMIFVMQQKPAIALTAENAAQLAATVTHTAADIPELIDPAKLVEIAAALKALISGVGTAGGLDAVS
jgi:aminopeptidase YwaD